MTRIASVFLDRDGTVIVDKHYLSDPAGVELLPGAAQGLRRLAAAGTTLYLVTNQSGIGRGFFSVEEYHACDAALVRILGESGVHLAGSAFCPHAPEEECICRKPDIGMWETLRRAHDLDPTVCAMVGDKIDDIAFGRNAGFATTVLVLTGKGEAAAAKLDIPPLGPDEAYRAVPEGKGVMPHCVARDLDGAAAWILSLV